MRPVLVALAAFAVIFLLLAWSRWLAGRRRAAAGQLLAAALTAAVVAVVAPLAAYLERYDARLAQLPVAELFFERIGANRYRVTLTRLPAGQMQVLDLTGDQWRLDLGLVAWSAWTAPLGLESRHRVERLASRLARPNTAGPQSGVSQELTEPAGPLPWLTRLVMADGQTLLLARQVTGPWQPMVPGARFDVRLLPDDVLAVDPLNDAARAGLESR